MFPGIPGGWRWTGGGRGGGGRGGGAGAEAEKQALGQGGTIEEQVAAMQSGSRGKPGYNPRSESAWFHRRPRHSASHGKPEEIRRGVSAFSASSCEVKTDGGSLAVTFPGMKIGIFAGNLRFTVYRGTNLIRMDAIAQTNEPWVAYKYDAGLKGFSTDADAARDVARHRRPSAAVSVRRRGQRDARAASRPRIGCSWPKGKGGVDRDVPAAAHVLLHARSRHESRYVWYRKDGGDTFGIGVDRRSARRRRAVRENFALFNAPPGT